MFPFLVDFGRVNLPLLGPVRLALPTYGFVYAIAVLGAFLWLRVLARRDGLDVEPVGEATFLGLIGGLIGAKLGLLLVDLDAFVAEPRLLLSAGFIQAAGVVWVGILGGTAGFLYGAWRHGLPPGVLLDAVIGPVAAAQAVGRLGCLAAGCCYGAPCPRPFGIVYESVDAHARTGVPLGVPLHPFPLYEAAWNLLAVLPVILWLRRRPGRVPGDAIVGYFVAYGIGRFALEVTRGDRARGTWFGGALSTSQLISLLVVPAVAAGWLVLRRRLRTPTGGPGVTAA